MIYADNAATTKLDSDAFDAMKPFLLEQYANASQPYSFSRMAKSALKEARETIASCINANPEEIFFTSGGTESDNWAIKGSMAYGDDRATITSSIEHHAVLRACASIERLGYSVAYLPADKFGTILPETLEQMITLRTKLVSVMLVNNEIGTIEPIKALSAIAHGNGALFHTDAVQAVGHIQIDVRDLGIDMLSASGHKFNGPKGIGFLYVKKGVRLSSFMDGGSQEFGMRAGTENVASIVGMAVALKKNCSKMQDVQQRLFRMEETFIRTLKGEGIDFMRNGAAAHAPGNISISIKNANGEMILHRLDLKGICISTGSACDSVNTQVSHVIDAIHTPEAYAEGTIRVSFGACNEEMDAVAVAQSIASILKA